MFLNLTVMSSTRLLLSRAHYTPGSRQHFTSDKNCLFIVWLDVFLTILCNISARFESYTVRPTEKLLAQAGFELAPSRYRSDALPIELLSPTKNDVQI